MPSSGSVERGTAGDSTATPPGGDDNLLRSREEMLPPPAAQASFARLDERLRSSVGVAGSFLGRRRRPPSGSTGPKVAVARTAGGRHDAMRRLALGDPRTATSMQPL